MQEIPALITDLTIILVVAALTTLLCKKINLPSVLGYILQLLVGKKFGGRVTWDELGLPCTDSGMALPCGATGRWFSE